MEQRNFKNSLLKRIIKKREDRKKGSSQNPIAELKVNQNRLNIHYS